LLSFFRGKRLAQSPQRIQARKAVYIFAPLATFVRFALTVNIEQSKSESCALSLLLCLRLVAAGQSHQIFISPRVNSA
jgi:hypothetical protein